MAIFPIHILEFITLCLILLSVFRIFKALSLELNIETSQPSVTNQGTNTLVSKSHVLNQKNNNQEPKSEPALKLVASNEKPLPTIQTTSEKADQHQTVLKNYIGDFF